MKVETETRKQKVLPLRTHFGRALMRPRWVSRARSFVFYGKNFACKILHKRANEHPTSIELDARVAVSFLFQLSSVTEKEAETNVVCKSKVRATSMFASFLNLQTQKLKLSAFAPCCEIYLARNGALRESKGHSAPWRVFSSFLSRDKKDNAHSRRALCGGKQEEKLSKNQPNEKQDNVCAQSTKIDPSFCHFCRI